MVTLRTKSWWEQHVDTWNKSGLSADQYCDRAGVNPRALAWWESRLHKGYAGSGGSEAAPEFVEVTSLLSNVVSMESGQEAGGALGAEPSADAPTPVELDFGSVQVRVTTGFDCGTLSRVLDVLEARR